MSNMQDTSSETGIPDFIPALEDEIASLLIGSKSLSYVQPTLVDRVKTFFAKKQLSQGHAAEPSPGNSGAVK